MEHKTEDVASLKTTVEKEIKKIEYYGILIQQHMAKDDFPKQQRIVDTTLPSKLNLMEDLIDKTSEMMIDEDFVLSEIQKWTMGTRQAIEETVNWAKRGKSMVETYHKRKVDETQAKMIEHERRKREEERKEFQMHEKKLYTGKLKRERAAWREHQEIALETKRRELEMEKRIKSQNAKLPKLILLVKAQARIDWIRFADQYIEMGEGGGGIKKSYFSFP